jgi:hypothetical protein
MILQGWHGGRNWTNPPEIRAPKLGRYEHGCGIYLTNVWSRAAKYAKGGGSVMRITLEVEPPNPEPVPKEEVENFVKSCPGLRRKESILQYLAENHRDRFMPYYLNNLCVNEKSLTKTSSQILAKWLTDHGTPFTLSDMGRTGGVSEEWMVIFDPNIIVAVDQVRSAELDRLPNYGDRNFLTFSEQVEAVCEESRASTPGA